MNYRSIAQLNQLISQNLDKVPLTVDLIVGVPRSGLLAAAIIALKLNLPLTDVAGLCEHRLIQAGKRGGTIEFEKIRHVLIVDDSIWSGNSLNTVREKIEALHPPFRIDYAAIYIIREAQKFVDYFWEVCPLPRIFEWNVMHHFVIHNACVDIDGVLCRNPTEEENDDGERYINFLKNTPPLIVPAGVIKTIVTCRLEKYRHLTEVWLSTAGIHYEKLIMLDMPDGKSRRKWNRHGEYKGEIYKQSDTWLFIESSLSQAHKIADIASKPVLAIVENQMIYPGTRSTIKAAKRRLPNFLIKILKKTELKLLKKMFPNSY